MTTDVSSRSLEDAAQCGPVDVLAIGAHPDDVEWGCGGVLAGLAGQGLRVGILVLTRGEAGTRGDAELRRTETEAGARCLGARCLGFLDCGDGQLRSGESEEEQVMFFLRRLQPTLVLAPPLQDRHPDHERAAALVRSAHFYSGLIKRQSRNPDGALVHSSELPPFRPKTLMHYMLHDPFEPGTIVDCTPVWSSKIAALAAHKSQFPTANGAARGLPSASSASGGPSSVVSAERNTWVSKRSFWDAIEGRGRHYGQRIGVEFAEALFTGGPLGLGADQFCALHFGCDKSLRGTRDGGLDGVGGGLETTAGTAAETGSS